MSYAVYTTEGIIIRLIPEGEASLNVVFFTKDLGKVIARAQSARKLESKMRMNLTRYHHVLIDLVRGKNTWRLTGIAAQEDKNRRGLIFPKIAQLVEHLVVGEMTHPELFHFLSSMIEQESRWNQHPMHGGLELFGVIKVLEKLGYWNGHVFPEIATEEILATCLSDKKRLVGQINESLSATQIVV